MSKYYMFTNYYFMPEGGTDEKGVHHEHEDSSKLPFEYLISQIEKCPKTGRLHEQGYVCLKKKMRFVALKDIMPTAWFGKRKGTHSEAKAYCRKEDTRYAPPCELGNDDNATTTSLPINAVIETSEFDIDDGDHFGFVWRILPDITFTGTDRSQPSPQVTMTLIPMQNSGSGYNDPISLGGNSSATIVRTSEVVIEQFTGQVYVRVRGRQMILKIESNQLGCAWQLGSPRIDIKQDGRRGNS